MMVSVPSLHDNASSHKSDIVKSFLASEKVVDGDNLLLSSTRVPVAYLFLLPRRKKIQGHVYSRWIFLRKQTTMKALIVFQ